MAILTIRGPVPTILMGAAKSMYAFVALADTDGMPFLFVRVRVEYGETDAQAVERAKLIAERLSIRESMQ
jgi:hypothetical protein